MSADGPPIESPVLEIPDVRPITGQERLPAIDTLRGLAIFGILLVNMSSFNAPLDAARLGTVLWPSLPDCAARWVIRTLAEGKFYTLFSFLFGLGMAIQMERVEARGGCFARLYLRRLAVLLLIGACHVVLLWYGDVLVIYALLGFPLLLFRRLAAKTILICCLLAYLIPILIMSASLAPEQWPSFDGQTAAQAAPWDGWTAEDVAAAMEPDIATYGRGSFAEIMVGRLEDYRSLLSSIVKYFVPQVFAMFLLGLWVGRRRILHDPAPHERLLRRLVLWGLPFGLLCNAGFTALLHIGGEEWLIWPTFEGYVLQWVGVPPLAFGYAAGVVLLIRSDAWRRRLAPLAAVGRMALSNYLLQTLICTTLFYSYGLGLFGKVGPALGLLMTVVIFALQIPLSVWWLHRFRFGPMEWLWRSLTYARRQPMRRVATD